jgi:hypothetical protein
VATLDAAHALARDAARIFDPDVYRIAARVLQGTGAKLVPLGA